MVGDENVAAQQLELQAEGALPGGRIVRTSVTASFKVYIIGKAGQASVARPLFRLAAKLRANLSTLSVRQLWVRHGDSAETGRADQDADPLFHFEREVEGQDDSVGGDTN